jgi:hypothetical protein
MPRGNSGFPPAADPEARHANTLRFTFPDKAEPAYIFHNQTMKHLLPALFLLITAAPLLANDEGGDGAYIPSYQELVREGYGPRDRAVNEDPNAGNYLALNYGVRAAPKPTQAYYGRGYVVYYGYQMVRMYVRDEEDSQYAFGHPISYYRQLLPQNVNEDDIGNVAVEVRNSRYYAPGDYVAQRHYPTNYTTTVQRT